MTPQEHYEQAEALARMVSIDDLDGEPFLAVQLAQVHATLALMPSRTKVEASVLGVSPLSGLAPGTRVRCYEHVYGIHQDGLIGSYAGPVRLPPALGGSLAHSVYIDNYSAARWFRRVEVIE